LTPRCTIIIPCYNQAKYLEDCIGSLQSQTMEQWEAIIIDDASQDNISAFFTQLSDPRISIIRHESNRGLAAARNSGFRAARSEYVIPLDADDLLKPTCLQSLLDILISSQTLDGVFGDFELFGKEKGVWTFDGMVGKELMDHQTVPGAGILMRRSLWERVGGYCELDELRTGNEDWDFWLSAAELGFHVRRIAKILYCYRRYSDSMSVELHKTDYIVREFMYSRHRNLFNQYRMGNKFRYVGYINSGVELIWEHKFVKGLFLISQGLQLYPGFVYLLRMFTKKIRSSI
jgi:glycosyltransferase involved in cell wall biosynthesis